MCPGLVSTFYWNCWPLKVPKPILESFWMWMNCLLDDGIHSPRSDEELKHWGRFVTEKQLVPRVPTNAWSIQAIIYAYHLARKHYFCGAPSIICPDPFIDILQLKNWNFQVSCGFLWLQSHYNILKCQWLDLINRLVGFVAWGGGYQQLAEDVLSWRFESCEQIVLSIFI